jgi:lambda family phage tail tape measure protein
MDMAVALKISAGVTGQQAVDQLRTSMDRLDGTVGKIKIAFGALGGAAVLAGFVGMIKGAIDAGDKLNDLSQKTGIAVEDLDALGFAAELNGSNLDQVSGALSKLAKNMAEAAGGSKEAIAVFGQFGISQAEIKSGAINTTEAMARIADKIAAMPDGWQKAAAAQKVFGKSAADIVPLLNAGGNAIRDARAELEGYGALFTGGFAKASDDFNDQMVLMRRMAGALSLSFAKELLPVMSGFLKGLIDAKMRIDDVAGDMSLAEWAGESAKAIAALVDVIRVSAQSTIALAGSFQAVWADIKLAGTFLAGGEGLNPFSAENKKILNDALAERNATVEAANQRYVTLWKMNGSATFDAVKAQMDKLKSTVKQAGEPGTAGKGGGGFGGFDFGAGKESEFEKYKKQLEEQLSKTGELTKAEETLRLVQTDRFKEASAAERQQLVNIAKQIDSAQTFQKIQELARKEAGAIEMLRLEGEQVNMTAREYQKLVAVRQHELEVAEATKKMSAEDAARYREAADGLFKMKEGIKQVNYEQSRTFETGAKRAFNTYIDQIQDVARSTEAAFSNAFRGMEDALVNFVMTGKLNFKDLASSILQDMARMLIQQQIMAPLMAAAKAGFGFADGGVMTSGGPMPLKTYSNGGIANSPQLALFGEGRMNEAYVPLPDGRSIPVTMQGGAAGGNVNNVTVNVSVENTGDQVKGDQGADNLGRVIANAVKSELINQKRPGGLLAA